MVAQLLGLLDEITTMSQQLDQDSELNLSTTKTINTRAERVGQLVQAMSGAAKDLQGLSTEVRNESTKTRHLTDETIACQNESRKITRQLEKRLGEIENHSSSIQKIARLTNLLALNAQIEAMAAGDAGLGFQVVAENVKAMASSTGQSSVEIQNTMHVLLSDSVQNIDSVEQSAELLDQVHSGIRHVDEQMQTQQQASTQMAEGLLESSDSISIIIDEMNQLNEIALRTQQGAHLTRDALVKLQKVSSSLSTLVAEFRQ
jgi:methyl-accepting chemotaxis protein